MTRAPRPRRNDVAAGAFAGGTLSEAWLATVAGVDAASGQKLFHTLTRVGRPGEETEDIRQGVDRLLLSKKLSSVETVANTIFPAAMASRCASQGELAERYRALYPSLRRFPGNGAGTYFGRMVAFPSVLRDEPFDQLGKIIDRLRQQLTHPGPMSTPYQLNIEAADPAIDPSTGPGDDTDGSGDDGGLPAAPVYTISDNSTRGFPCMSFVHFQTDGHNLHAYAHYRYEYLIEKGYGNYLGLARLQRYMADQVALRAGVLTISTGRAHVDATSTQVRTLPHERSLFE